VAARCRHWCYVTTTCRASANQTARSCRHLTRQLCRTWPLWTSPTTCWSAPTVKMAAATVYDSVATSFRAWWSSTWALTVWRRSLSARSTSWRGCRRCVCPAILSLTSSPEHWTDARHSSDWSLTGAVAAAAAATVVIQRLVLLLFAILTLPIAYISVLVLVDDERSRYRHPSISYPVGFWTCSQIVLSWLSVASCSSYWWRMCVMYEFIAAIWEFDSFLSLL